jgi:prepilin-type N-terminal cleavage/methylation domain-containing protein
MPTPTFPQSHPPAASRSGPRERGFSLVELLVSLAAMTIIILGALMVFDFNSRLARVQTQVSDMQQSLRTSDYEIVRTTRMAGRGGLPMIGANYTYPRGVALEVRDNVGTGATPPSRSIAIGYASSPNAVLGTDILTVRGVFNSPIYQLNSTNAAAYKLFIDPSNASTQTSNPLLATGGTVQICAKTPAGVVQDLGPLSKAITDGVSEALVLVSPLGEQFYGVVELTAAGSDLATPSTCTGGGLTLGFRISGTTASNAYRTLGPLTAATGLDSRLNSVAFVGILEEYRYYVREEYSIAGNAATEPAPRFSMARMFPGSETPYKNDSANLSLDITDGNIADLQVALGIDVNADGTITSGATTAAMATDEWLYNAVADDPTSAGWRIVPGSSPPRATPPFYARISLLTRTDRRDPNYTAPLLTTIEDRSYSATGETANLREQRMFRRRILQTVVDLRNLS